MSLLRIPSVSSPLHRVCNTTTYYLLPRGCFPSVKALLDNRSIHDDVLPRRVATVFQIAFLYCCRISELLDSRHCDVVPPDRLVCKGKKGSNSYIIYLPGLSQFIYDNGFLNSTDSLFPFKYAYLYRWAVRIGIPVRLDKRNNNAVLHLSRYVFSNKCIDRQPSSAIGECLRHRSKDTINYYLNKGV